MQWDDEAIILSVKKHGETSAVVRVLSRAHGLFAGIVKGASSKANRGLLQPGNVVNAHWNARLSEHMGMFRIELIKANAALIMNEPTKLAALSCACTIVELSLPERHPYARLYTLFLAFLTDLQENENWMEDYVSLELDILAEAGFGLDLSRCAATATTENLTYVSPKSGRAVSFDAGEPYKDKLLKLPSFLLPSPKALPLSREAGEGQGGGLTSHARNLRKNMTDVETDLWYHLRAHRFEGYGFRRQRPIGNYIVDFVCMDEMLVVELDGSQHAEQQAYDAARTAYLENQGYRVLRFWNNDITENMEGVLTTILQALNNKERAPSLTLPRKRERGQEHPLSPKGGGLGRGSSEIIDGLALTGYFLEHWLLAPHNRKLPAVRGRLIQTLYKPAETL